MTGRKRRNMLTERENGKREETVRLEKERQKKQR